MQYSSFSDLLRLFLHFASSSESLCRRLTRALSCVKARGKLFGKSALFFHRRST